MNKPGFRVPDTCRTRMLCCVCTIVQIGVCGYDEQNGLRRPAERVHGLHPPILRPIALFRFARCSC